jgi:hypothetical protein
LVLLSPPQETMAAPTEQRDEGGIFGTQREDLWWVPPTIIAIGFTAFIVYSTWAAWVGEHFFTGLPEAAAAAQGTNYLSPFYSPCLLQGCEHGFLAGVIPLEIGTISPAFFILWAPLGFRATCYYYRKAYYRSYFADPPACAVDEPRDDYQGETSFPFILQNIHRYFLPFSLALVGFLTYDAILAFKFSGGWGIGVGSIVLSLNAILLATYTFGCHSLRHLVGGGKDCFTCDEGDETVAKKSWDFVTFWNENHMLWAWLSLFWVAFADLYVRLVSMGVIQDLHIVF